MDMFISQVAGFALGIATSWLFWRYMLLLRPSVRVSPIVAKGHSRKEPHKVAYRFKIANYGRRQAISISLGVTICRLANVPGGQISAVVERLPFNRDTIPVLGPKSKLGDSWGLSPIYTFVSKPDFDVLALMANDERLLLTLTATDAVSGTTVVTRKVYAVSNIREGDFARGLGFEIGPEQLVVREGDQDTTEEEQPMADIA